VISFKKFFLESEKTWCAIVLDEDSVNNIKKAFHVLLGDLDKKGWRISCNHMTIDDNHPLVNESDLGKTVTLTVMSVAYNSEYYSVKVSGYERQDGNDFSHVTLAEIPEVEESPEHLPLKFVPYEFHLGLTGTIQNITKNRRLL
jgi:hypothetical protein